jgi:GNAT superfamily N-acetyltransferase
VENLRYAIETAPFSPELVSAVTGLAAAVFDTLDVPDFEWRLANLPEASLALASSPSGLLGFKFGHALSSKRYQSWLGGVHPNARRQGIARRLMALQHEWAADRGFSSIETSAAHDNAAMLAVNRAAGFAIIGEYERDGLRRLIHHKRLGDD